MKIFKQLLVANLLFVFSSSLHAAYTPNHRDSGWVALFNGKNLDGLYPHVEGGNWGENLNNVISVHDSMIHIYQGLKRSANPQAPMGVLSTGNDFSFYQSRVEYKAGDIKDDGWLKGDPYNSGFFYHAHAGGPVWPPAIECQLKIHWNSNAVKPCTAAAGDCNDVFAGDYWLLSGVQIQKDGVTSQLGGCCQPTYGNHKPDAELTGWNTMEIQVYGDSIFKNILNKTEVNHGSKSTWQNADGKRVPLTSGRVQLELEGSEFYFKNWEIRLFKQDSLYSTWYVEGCMDPGYKEYSKTANLHIQSLCKSLNAASIEKSHIDFNQAGQYDITVKDFTGKIVAQHHQTNPKSLDIGMGLKTGLYFMEVKKGNEKFYSKFSRVE